MALILKRVSCAPRGQLRELAELEPERNRAADRFKSEATEETWQDDRRLRGGE